MKNDDLFNDMLRHKPKLETSIKKNRYRAELAEELVRMRKRAGLTQTELARKLGWQQPQVSTIEKATGPVPDAWRVMAYADACGVHSENTWIFTFNDHETRRIAM